MEFILKVFLLQPGNDELCGMAQKLVCWQPSWKRCPISQHHSV